MMDFLTSAAAQAAITSIAEIVVGLAVAFAAYLLHRFTGIQLTQAAVDRLKSAASTEAGALIAKAEDNLRNQKVATNDAPVIDAAARIAERNPDAVKLTGVTPGVLQRFVVGEIGKLQAQQGPVVLP